MGSRSEVRYTRADERLRQLMLCPSCGTRNVVGAMTCVVCGQGLPASTDGGDAPAVRPEILRARRPSPLAPPSLEGLPQSEQAPLERSADERGAVEEGAVDEAPAEPVVGPEPVVGAEPVAGPEPVAEPDGASAEAAPAAVSPPSSHPAVAPSLSPGEAAPRTFTVAPGRAPLPRWLLAALVDGVVALAPAVMVASLVAPPPPPGAPLWEVMVEALLMTPACTAALVLTGTLIHAAHLGITAPRFGATLGGSVAGLGLRTTHGDVLSAGRAALRGVFGGLLAFAFLAGPLYAVWVDGRRRTLGDLVARTAPVRHSLGGA